MQAAVKGQGSVYLLAPALIPGPGACRVQRVQFTQQLCPQGLPEEPQPAPAPGFHWGGPSQEQDGGLSVPAKTLGPFLP